MKKTSSGESPGTSATVAPKRRRWVRRLLIVGAVLVFIIVSAGVGGYFYLSYQFNKITKVNVPNLQPVAKPKPGAPSPPFTVLLVGSDSRAFVDTPAQCAAFQAPGECGSVTGQRSDVIILVRVVPATRQIEMISIPRDTWVAIPGHVPDISGENRINAAFNDGPTLLVQTIQQDFHIPVNYYVEVNFVGLQKMVDAIDGIHLDFPYPVKDTESGLNVTTTGCQLVHGATALALVRSRNLQWESSPGVWSDDPNSDFTRIRNQQAFFRAVITQLNAEITNPLALNGFINVAAGNLTIDRTLSEGTLLDLAREFHDFSPGELKSETLPTLGPYWPNPEAEVLLPSAVADQAMIEKFLTFGTTTASPPKGAATTPVTTVAPAPAGEAPIYNDQTEPYDVAPC
jgi:LCP family protein required for cell wall assembly